jgi:hypothetical protein
VTGIDLAAGVFGIVLCVAIFVLLIVWVASDV